MEAKLDDVDAVEAQIAAIEERLGVKLDTQHGILVALIDIELDNEIIRQDGNDENYISVPWIETSKIAKAQWRKKKRLN